MVIQFAMLALSAVSAAGSAQSQYAQGLAAKGEAELNATILEGKAGLIDVQKGIENKQYIKAKERVLSSSLAYAAGSGLGASGSAMAIMLETQKQMSLDQAVGQFNFDMEKRYTRGEADARRRQGKMAVRTGKSRAFSTLLSDASKGIERYAEIKGA